MSELDALRAGLDTVDRELVRLFERRMLLCREIAAYKQAHGLPVLDRSREETVLSSRAGMLEDPAFAQDVREVWTLLMALSRAEQEKRMGEAQHT